MNSKKHAEIVYQTKFKDVIHMDPILMDIPTEFYTDRLYIRLPKPGDGKVVHEAIEASLNELRPWMLFANYERDEADTELGVREAHAKFITRDDLRLYIFLKDTMQFIGSSGLHNPNWNVPSFEIGYWIDSRFSGKGYMTEAVRGITDYAFEHLNARRIEIRCDRINRRSIAIPERLGYTFEGSLRNHDISVDGKTLRDTVIYAKVR